ncbi:MAG: DUF6962 family protein [Salibacteraceae bacterium]
MEKASIELFGYILMEPVTFLTDLFLTLFSLGLYNALRKSFPVSDYRKHYGKFFLFMAFCTFLGGVAHLLGHYLDHFYIHAVAWSFSAIGIYYMQKGSAYDYSLKVSTNLGYIFLFQVVVSVCCYIGFQLFGNYEVESDTVGTPGFTAVVVSSTIGFAGFILPLHLIKYIKEKDNGAAIMIMAFVCSIITPIIQAKKWGLGIHFNHNDVAHMVLALCYYVYYLGMRTKIQQYETTSENA